MSERDEPGNADGAPPPPAEPWTTSAPDAESGSATDGGPAADAPGESGAAPPTTFAWSPELASGQVPGDPPLALPSRGRPVLDVLVWVVGIVVSLGFAVVIAGLQARSGPASAFEGGRRVGEIVGEVLAAFLVAFGLWALVVWVSRRRGRARRLTSPIVPLIAIVFLGLAFTNVVTRPESAAALRAAAGATHTLDQVLVIDPPYRLDTAPPEEERQFLDLFTGSQPGAFKTVVMRRIYEGEDLVGYAIVADAEVKPGAEAVAMGGVELGLGGQDVTKTHTTLAGHDVISGTAGGAGYTVWVEAPFVKIVFAPVESDAATIAERFISD